MRDKTFIERRIKLRLIRNNRHEQGGSRYDNPVLRRISAELFTPLLIVKIRISSAGAQ